MRFAAIFPASALASASSNSNTGRRRRRRIRRRRLIRMEVERAGPALGGARCAKGGE